jgi:hypothetical protein
MEVERFKHRQGRRPWGRLGAPVTTLPHDIGTGKAEEGEKDTRTGLIGWGPCGRETRGGRWYAGLCGLKE